MNRNHNTLSTVRAASPFATPPRVLVVADDDDMLEAVELAEALDGFGADAEVCTACDAREDHHRAPDAVIFAGAPGSYHTTRHHPLLIGLTNGSEASESFDLVMCRPFSAASLMEQLGERLTPLGA